MERRGLEGAHRTTASGWTEGSAVQIPPLPLNFSRSISRTDLIRYRGIVKSAIGSVLGNKSGKMEKKKME